MPAVVAITGTKGKSTTAALTAAILAHDGSDVALIGNIGVPVVERYGMPLADAYVVEVSSYQAADVQVSPGLVVLTSLAPDHLDWHGSEEAYYRDKLRLIEAGPPGALAVNAGSGEALRRTAGHPRRTLFGPSGRVTVDGAATVTVDGEMLVDGSDLRLPGAHNLWQPVRRHHRGHAARRTTTVGGCGGGGGGGLRGAALALPDGRGAGRSDLRRRRPGLQPVRLGRVHRRLCRSGAHGHSRWCRPGCRSRGAGGGAGAPSPDPRGGGPPTRRRAPGARRWRHGRPTPARTCRWRWPPTWPPPWRRQWP